MALPNTKTLKLFAYTEPAFRAPQIFREPVFARTHIPVSLCLDDDFFFLAEDYLIIFPSFFLRFNSDQTISFLNDNRIQCCRNQIFGIPLHLVSDIATGDNDPKIPTDTASETAILGSSIRRTAQDTRSIPEPDRARDNLGCVRIRIGGDLFYLSTKNTKRYNQIFYHNSDYNRTFDHFNKYVHLYHRELEDLVGSGILFPVRELNKRRAARREKLCEQLNRYDQRIHVIDEELSEEKFSFSPLRFKEKRSLKARRKELLTEQRGLKNKLKFI